jgi:hypothetical protein
MVQSRGSCHFIVHITFGSTLHGSHGAPASVLVAYELDPEKRRLDATLTWQNKTSTRMPEAMTVFSRPSNAKHRWMMNSLGEWVSLSNFTLGGEQYMHAIWSGIRYTGTDRASSTTGLWITSPDAGMVCPVLNKAADTNLTEETALQKACFEYDIRSPGSESNQQQVEDTMIHGVGINLHNNRMGISGFAQWYPFGVGSRYQKQDETAQFRFVIEERLDHVEVDTSFLI